MVILSAKNGENATSETDMSQRGARRDYYLFVQAISIMKDKKHLENLPSTHST